MKKINSILALITIILTTGISTVGLSEQKLLRRQNLLRPVEQRDTYIGNRELVSYKALPVRTLTQNDAREILGRIQKSSRENSSFDKVQQAHGRFVFISGTDPSAVFDIDQQNGSFLLNYGLKKYSADESTRNLPSAQEAPVLARKYLAETGSLPENERELVVAHVGGLDMAVSKEGKNTGSYKKLVTVQYSRILNGLPVQGQGSRIVIHLGEDGALAGMIRNWPAVKAAKIQKNELKTDELIRSDIRKQLRELAGEAIETSVPKSSLVLFDDGRGIIEPALYVVVQARYKGPANERFIDRPVDFYVPVLKKPKAYYPFMKSRESRLPGADKQQITRKTISSPKSGEQEQSDQR